MVHLVYCFTLVWPRRAVVAARVSFAMRWGLLLYINLIYHNKQINVYFIGLYFIYFIDEILDFFEFSLICEMLMGEGEIERKNKI